jgi:hypothetical protein
VEINVLGIAYDEFTNAQREGKAESVYFKSKAGAKVFRTGSDPADVSCGTFDVPAETASPRMSAARSKADANSAA